MNHRTELTQAPSSARSPSILARSRSGPPAWVWDIVGYAPVATGAAATLLGASALLGSAPRALARRPKLATLVAFGGVAMLLKTQLERHITEQARYVPEREIDGLEIRRYPARLVAETVVEGAFDEAREEGFRRLAGYIFGGNHARAKIAMTAPVNVAKRERIAMTAPVNVARRGGAHVVTFTMPRGKTIATLPEPNDPRVIVREAPASRIAVLRTHGSYDGEHIEAKKRELLERVRAVGLAPKGEVAFAGYDAPAVIPVLRRVELWVPIA